MPMNPIPEAPPAPAPAAADAEAAASSNSAGGDAIEVAAAVAAEAPSASAPASSSTAAASSAAAAAPDKPPSSTAGAASSTPDKPATRSSQPGPGTIEFEPPLACVRRLLKHILPSSTNVGKDASAVFTRACGIFVIYLTACANDCAKEKKRQTITATDVLEAARVSVSVLRYVVSCSCLRGA